MAIDSRDKRAGATGQPWAPLHPLPDGEISQADRQQVVGVYPGILAGAEEAAYYNVYRGQDGNIDYVTPVAVMALDDTDVDIISQDLPPDTIWHYVRRKVAPCGLESDDSPVCIIMIDENGDMFGLTPNVPQDLTVEAVAGGELLLRWRYSSTGHEVSPTGFKIYMDSGSGFDFDTPVATVNCLAGLVTVEYNWTSDALTHGQLYKFIVRSYYTGGGETANTNYVAATADAEGPDALVGAYGSYEEL